MAQSAKNESHKNESGKNASDEATDQGKRAAGAAADTAREATDRAEGAARRNLQLVDEAGEAASQVGRTAVESAARGSAEFGRTFSDIVAEQTRFNIKVMHELTDAVDWEEVARIQSEFLRFTLERTAVLTQRYLELAQSMITSTASTAEQQVRKRA